MSLSSLRTWGAVTIGFGVVATAVGAPDTLVDHRAPVLRAILETAVLLIGTLATLLAVGRLRRSGELGDLAIVCAVALLAWMHTLFGTVPDLINPHSVGNGISERVEIWGTVVVRTMAVGFLVAAVAADPQLGRHPVTRRPIRRGLLVTAAAGLAAFALLVWLAPSGRGGLLGDPGGTDVLRSALQGLDAVLAFVASYLLARRATARSDPFLGWIATGCVFFGFAMISYALLPAGDSDWLRSGDLLRAAALATWAIGAVCEILSYWSTISDGARHEARRSVALDLHDGLAQELALLATSMHAPPDERSQPQWHEQAHRTAERALAEARRAIAALVADEALPLRADLEQTAESVSGSDVDVHVQIGSGAGAASLDPFQREAIVRIVREAVTNAVRHGGARHIDIQFGEEGSPALRVCDDGLGFELDRVGGPGHFGLASMQEMAASLGASLAVHSEPEHGTTVEVLWP